MSEHQMKKSLVRWLVPSGIIIFCILTMVFTTDFERMPPILKRGIQPSDFPQLVAGLIILLCLLSLWREHVKVTEDVKGPTWVAIGLIILFAALTPIDFFLALGVFASALAFSWGERRIAGLALVGIALPLFVFLLFDLVFSIRFPRGILTNLWYG